ncbi:MAG: toll/interleukin-1 receptor domain-containing protein [Olsenella umbonata]|nr:toll/interleukin-1 receptor domain-containing protein [Parafannyhessea umbonata]
MRFDVFISYAWTSCEHCEWVRLLAANLRHMGFDVGIDAKVDYGNDLDGFMRKIPESKHVLMIVDDNYTYRADNLPGSGVATENAAIRDVIDSKPENWLAPLLVRNKEARLPKWLNGRKLKYFDFRADREKESFPGAEQIDDLWRWLVGLPPDKEHAVSNATLRKRAYRIEKVDELRSPGTWSRPELMGQGVEFSYEDAPRNTIVLGAGVHSFSLSVSKCNEDSIYVYADDVKTAGSDDVKAAGSDDVKAVGLVTDGISYDKVDADSAFAYITPGRTITPRVGQSFILMNDDGVLCSVALRDVTYGRNDGVYEKPKIIFDYKILIER